MGQSDRFMSTRSRPLVWRPAIEEFLGSLRASVLPHAQYGTSLEAAVAQCRQCLAGLLQREQGRRGGLQLSSIVQVKDFRIAGGHLRRPSLTIVADLQAADL